MQPVPVLTLSALSLAFWSGGALAQQASPSFNCRYASTETEIAICNSPALAELEMQMYGGYLALVERIGERQARRIADDLLERRQACGPDRSCIAQRLLVTMEVFRQRAEPEQQLAAVEPPEPEPEPVPEVAPIPESPEPPLAALEPWPPELESPTPEVAASEPTTEDDVLAALEPAPEDLEPNLPALEFPSENPTAEEAEVLAGVDPLAEDPAPSLSEPEFLSPENSLVEDEDVFASIDPLPEDLEPSSPEPEFLATEENLVENEDVLAAIAPSTEEVEPSQPEPESVPLEENLVEDEDVLAALAPLPEEAEPSQPATEPLEQDVEVASRDVALPEAVIKLDETDLEPAEPSATQPPEPETETAAIAPPLVEAQPEPPADEPSLGAAIEGAELTSAAPPTAAFDTPLSWAFMDLSRGDRAALQERLREAGYYEGQGTGIWEQATVDALNAFLASPEGLGFDSASASGAALILDYLGSDAFGRSVSADPLDAAEW
ncbi:hypothetical protein FHG66_12520 [Rubellimicrobium rubrum]|uniref:Peptidoglycan binding-like domain-containing protein n=1 Tax=Rubellimicrobium rubrum TaxID=2585369 RepID=A0A5C4MYD4_9RHOB|nr:hypothetical protein [Rubellimicrobium rubrum]TNC48983.1 hypothetical protein FHG66_12520 [Rubellimicrobium rubrum]